MGGLHQTPVFKEIKYAIAKKKRHFEGRTVSVTHPNRRLFVQILTEC